MKDYTSFTPTGRTSPYTVPELQQGWRRMTVPGDYKRKVFTLFWNDQVLVQANLSWGEKGIRHTHASGELTVTFTDALHPLVWYNPPGEWHGGSAGSSHDSPVGTADLAVLESVGGGDPKIVAFVKQLIEQQKELNQRIASLERPPGPHIDLDILFPPFQTTIDDPAYPGSPHTITGPWED